MLKHMYWCIEDFRSWQDDPKTKCSSMMQYYNLFGCTLQLRCAGSQTCSYFPTAWPWPRWTGHGLGCFWSCSLRISFNHQAITFTLHIFHQNMAVLPFATHTDMLNFKRLGSHSIRCNVSRYLVLSAFPARQAQCGWSTGAEQHLQVGEVNNG